MVLEAAKQFKMKQNEELSPTHYTKMAEAKTFRD